MRHLVPLVALVAACQPAFSSIDEACPEKVPGEGDNTEVAVGVFRRVGCYRRFAGLGPARMDSRISDAARAHALYVQQNGPASNPLLESPDEPAFTGVDPLERMIARGYELSGNFSASYGFWEGLFVYDESFDPEAIADDWMWGQYGRQGVLQPDWVDAGYGSTDSWAVVTILYDFPALEAIGRPVAWPRDGQTDVPPSWTYVYDDGAQPLFDPVGYPITFTVGSDDPDSSLGAQNPYNLVLLDSSLEGPDGPVEFNTVTPDSSPYDFPYTVALVPDAPFEANTTYTATVRLRWNGRETTGEFATTFTTGDDATSARRSRPSHVASRSPGGPLRTWTP